MNLLNIFSSENMTKCNWCGYDVVDNSLANSLAKSVTSRLKFLDTTMVTKHFVAEFLSIFECCPLELQLRKDGHNDLHTCITTSKVEKLENNFLDIVRYVFTKPHKFVINDHITIDVHYDMDDDLESELICIFRDYYKPIIDDIYKGHYYECKRY